MPFVKEHTRGGQPVKAHYRLISRWNFGFGLLLMLLFLHVAHH
jgi:hypothetical protein